MNGQMEREKQIEEIREMAISMGAFPDNCKAFKCNECPLYPCFEYQVSEHFYNAGYRKETQGEWISVEDRLPENDTQVLGYNGEIHCYIVTESDFIKEKTWWLDNEGWNTAKGFGITHWQPLPTPPKMKGAE